MLSPIETETVQNLNNVDRITWTSKESKNEYHAIKHKDYWHLVGDNKLHTMYNVLEHAHSQGDDVKLHFNSLKK
jgi:hypothetical protein